MSPSGRWPAAGPGTGRVRGRGLGVAVPAGAPDSPVGTRSPPAGDEDPPDRSDRYGRIGLSLTVLGLAAAAGRGGHPRPRGASGCRGATCTSSRSPARSRSRSAYLVLLVRRYDVRWLGLLRHRLPRDSCSASPSSCSTRRPARWCPPALLLARHPRVGGRDRRRRRSRSARSPRCSTCSEPARGQGRGRPGAARTVASSGGRRRPRRSTSSPTGSTPSRSRCGRSPSSPGAIWARVRLGPLLGLGPQGGLGVHHLGRYAAYLHARATAGWQGRGRGVRRAARLRDVPVQLRRRSTCSAPGCTPTRGSERTRPAGACSALAVSAAPAAGPFGSSASTSPASVRTSSSQVRTRRDGGRSGSGGTRGRRRGPGTEVCVEDGPEACRATGQQPAERAEHRDQQHHGRPAARVACSAPDPWGSARFRTGCRSRAQLLRERKPP